MEQLKMPKALSPFVTEGAIQKEVAWYVQSCQ